MIVSGDSLGHLMFWDGKRGTLKNQFNSHGADILALTAKGDSMVFAAGVDYKVAAYQYVKQGEGKRSAGRQWVSKGHRRYHLHDVRALAYDPKSDLVVSGGVDVSLVSCEVKAFPNTVQHQLPVFPNRYMIDMAKDHRMLMSASHNTVSLWRLGQCESVDDGQHVLQGNLPLLREPHQLLINLQLRPDCNITSSSLSRDAKWIAISDIETVRLFHLQELVSIHQTRRERRAYLSLFFFLSRMHLDSWLSKKTASWMRLWQVTLLSVIWRAVHTMCG